MRHLVLLLLLAAPGCATLGQVLQPPRFEVASDRQPEIRLLAPSLQRPLGGATVRLWASVGNPNPVGLVLSAVRGTLALEGVPAAEVDFPLGLPLSAQEETVIPLDISVGFADLPRLAEILPRAVTQGSVDYRLNGTLAVDAGLLGQPTFGPMTLLQGDIPTRR